MNQERAKLLAPVICAFAAGSLLQYQQIPYQDRTFGWVDFGWVDFDPIAHAPNFEDTQFNWRIKPKAAKEHEVCIALVNLAKLNDDNIPLGFTAQLIKREKHEPKWIPAEVIVKKSKMEDFKQLPIFVKWLSNPIQLLR